MNEYMNENEEHNYIQSKMKEKNVSSMDVTTLHRGTYDPQGFRTKT